MSKHKEKMKKKEKIVGPNGTTHNVNTWGQSCYDIRTRIEVQKYKNHTANLVPSSKFISNEMFSQNWSKVKIPRKNLKHPNEK